MEMSLTQKQHNVLTALLNGIHLTVLTAIDLCHTTELRRIVCRLEKRGYVIKRYRNSGERFLHYYMEVA